MVSGNSDGDMERGDAYLIVAEEGERGGREKEAGPGLLSDIPMMP